MKSQLFIAVIFLICFKALGQQDTLNQTDMQGLKQGYWIITNADHVKSAEGRYMNNLRTGVWKEYYASGVLRQEVSYVNDDPMGYARFYYSDGKINEEGIWQGNTWVGNYTFYYQNGSIMYQCKFDAKGKKSGQQKYFHDNGNVMIEGNWADGKENGTIREYDRNGRLLSEKTYMNGQLDESTVKMYSKELPPAHTDSASVNNAIPQTNPTPELELFTGTGFFITYTKDKRPDREGNWENGIFKDGKRYYYNESGKLVKTSIYKNGNVVNIIYNNP